MEKAKNKPKHKPGFTLREAIGFSNDDLVANQEGAITAQQRERLRWNNEKFSCIYIPITAFLTLVGIVLLYGDFLTKQVGPGILFFMLAVIFVINVWWTRFKSVIDLRSGEVLNIQGRIELDAGNSTFFVAMQDKRFKVTKPIFLAFKNGDPYVIYYLPRSKTILSAEWLRED